VVSEPCARIHISCLTKRLPSKTLRLSWYRLRRVDKCITLIERDGDQLDALILKLPAEMVARFGEIVWAKTGDKGQWWPSLIFDPRSFLGNAEVVELAKQNLGKRHLVYFFETPDAFGAIQDGWILKWNIGIERQYDIGKPVQGANKKRIHQFRLALQAATTAQEDSFRIPELGRASDPLDSDCRIFGVENSVVQKASTESQGDVEWSCFHQQENPTIPEGSSQLESNWLSARQYALAKVASLRHEPPVYMGDETFKGINKRSSGKWQVMYCFHEKSRYVGTFTTRGEAVLAYKIVRIRLRPREGESAPKALSDNHGRHQVGAVSEGAVNSSFSNLFSRRYSPKQQSDHGVFNDKRPSRVKYLLGRKVDHLKRDSKTRVSENRQERHSGHVQRSTRHTDQERALVVRSTPFCQFYFAPFV
jgi:hypothetical protein